MKTLTIKALITVFVLCLSYFALANPTCEGAFEGQQTENIEHKNNLQASSELYRAAVITGDVKYMLSLFRTFEYSKSELEVVKKGAIENNQTEAVQLLNYVLDHMQKDKIIKEMNLGIMSLGIVVTAGSIWLTRDVWIPMLF